MPELALLVPAYIFPQSIKKAPIETHVSQSGLKLRYRHYRRLGGIPCQSLSFRGESYDPRNLVSTVTRMENVQQFMARFFCRLGSLRMTLPYLTILSTATRVYWICPSCTVTVTVALP